jgi:serine/threonine protein kinase
MATVALSDHLLNLSEFSEATQLRERDDLSTQMYQECDDGLLILVKSIKLWGRVDNCHVERTIEDLVNVRHPCIAGAIGVVPPSPLQGLKLVRMYCGGISLSEVISTSPEWWTPTAKAKPVVSLVLGLRFAHSLGPLNGHLTGNNILFNDDGMIQISDFCPNGLTRVEGDQGAMVDTGGFSGESWLPEAASTHLKEFSQRL